MQKNNEILEVEAEEINPLEQEIDNRLNKANITDAVIASLKKQYSGLQLRAVDDKENYLIIKESRKNVRTIGISIEKIFKAGREDAVRTQKLWLKKESDYLKKLAEVQDPLDAEIKKFDDEVQRKEDAEKKRQEEQFIQRQSALLKYGARYQDGSFVLDHLSYESINIQEADEEIWNDIILAKYKKQFEQNETARVAEENKRKEETEKLKAEQEKFQKEQAEFKAQQEAFNKQKEETERLQRDEQIRKESEERTKRDTEIKSRCNQLSSLGLKFNFQYDAYVLDDINVDNKTEICLLNNTEWDALVNKITPVIEQRKKDAEEKLRKELIGKNRFEALKTISLIKDETVIFLSELSEIEWETLSESYKKEVKAAQEEQWKQQQKIEEENKKRLQEEESAKASDKEKWQALVNSIEVIVVPEFKSNIYKSKLASLHSLVRQIKAL